MGAVLVKDTDLPRNYASTKAELGVEEIELVLSRQGIR